MMPIVPADMEYIPPIRIWKTCTQFSIHPISQVVQPNKTTILRSSSQSGVLENVEQRHSLVRFPSHTGKAQAAGPAIPLPITVSPSIPS